MIWIKYCMDSWSERPVSAEVYFERLSRNMGRKRDGRETPLRDSLSKIYMRDFMYAHMTKHDWFSVILSDGSRIPMYALPRMDRFVLAVLNDSQRGKPENSDNLKHLRKPENSENPEHLRKPEYSRKPGHSGESGHSWEPGLAWEPLDDARWHFLSNLGFIIWLEATGEDFRNAGERLCGNEPYEILDYPFYGKRVDVTVLPGRLSERTETYERIDEPRRYVPESALYIGPDGDYYTDGASLREAFTGCWMTDIEDTIKSLASKIKRIWYLTDITRVWKGEDFMQEIVEAAEIRKLSAGAAAHLLKNIESTENKDSTKSTGNKESTKNAEYTESAENIKNTETTENAETTENPTDQFADCRIITHMISIPPTPADWVAAWKIDKKADGSYYLHGGRSVPYAGFAETIRRALKERSAGYERMELLVLDNNSDGQRFEVFFALKICADCIEIFEKNLAAKMFHDALQEAWQSGFCETQTPYCE